MILLDTNVVSEGMRVTPDPRVMSWLDAHPRSTLFISAITLDEITFGLNLLPQGRRRERLVRVFTQVAGLFGEPMPLDAKAASASAGYRSRRQLLGRPMSLADSQIAGIAGSNGLSLATLDVRDFQGIDLEVVVPRS